MKVSDLSDEMVCLETAEQSSPIDTEEQAELASSILTWGIVGLALGCTGIAALAGIFVSKAALNRAEEYAQKYGKRTGKALVGGHLARGGYYGSIGMTILLAVYYTVVFLMVIAMMDL